MFISQLHFAEWDRRKREPAKSRGFRVRLAEFPPSSSPRSFHHFPPAIRDSVVVFSSNFVFWFRVYFFFLFFFGRVDVGFFILLVCAIFVLDLVHQHILCWCNCIRILINFPFILYKRWRQSVFWRNSRICRRIHLLLAALVLFFFVPYICYLFRSSRLILLVMDLVLCP